jgi:hypothetical protein
MAKDEEVKLTRQELAELIASAVKAGADAARASAPVPTSTPFDPDKAMRDQTDAIRGVGRVVPAPEAIRRTCARSTVTFTAILFRERVVRLEDEVYPAGIALHAKDGGMVPDGLTILQRDGQKTASYKQWYWQAIRKPLFTDYVGRDRAWLLRMTNDPPA